MIKTKQFRWLTHLNTSADYPGLHKHYIYPLMPSPAHLLPLTGSVRRAVHRELGFNRWKKIWVYPSVPVNSQPWTARCGDWASRAQQWVSEWYILMTNRLINYSVWYGATSGHTQLSLTGGWAWPYMRLFTGETDYWLQVKPITGEMTDHRWAWTLDNHTDWDGAA